MSNSRRDFLKKSVAAATALGVATALPYPMSAASTRKKKFRQAKRVIIFTFDGIRVDGLKKARTPYIDSLISSGAASFATRDVMPSVTLPNYTSHLLGAGPEVHGVDNNDWTVDHFRIPAVVRDEDGYFPNVFQELKKNVPGIRTAFYYNWEPIINPHNTVNTASTVLSLFGVEQPLCWTGEVPGSIFY